MVKLLLRNKKRICIYTLGICFLLIAIFFNVKLVNQNEGQSTQKTNGIITPTKKIEVNTAEQFGANGFDKRTDTKALQKAIDQSDTLILKSGATYIIDKPLVSSHSIKIKSDNKGKKAPVILQLKKESAFIFNNKSTAATSVVEPISKNDKYITLKSTKGLKPGDLLHLISNKLWYWDNRGYLSKGELHKILKVSGSKVYLERNTNEDYEVGKGEVVTARAYPNVNLEMADITFSHPKAYPTAMVKINYTSNTKLNNISVGNSKHTGILLNYTYQTEVKNAYINLGTTKEINTGYGIQDYGGTGTLVTDSTFKKVRRGVDFSGSTPSRFGIVSNSKAYGYKPGTLASGNSGFGTHSTAENILFKNNYVENFNYAFLTRGNNIIVEGNTLSGLSNHFIAISYGGKVEVRNNIYNSIKNSQLESFIKITDTYKGSLISTGNTVTELKGNYISGDVGQLEQLTLYENSVIKK